MVKRSEPVNIIKMKKTNHLTKKELEFREEQEKSVLTGTPLQEFPEVKADPVAHEEFVRIRKDFRKIEKSDDLFSGVINRYCMLYSEWQGKMPVMMRHIWNGSATTAVYWRRQCNCQKTMNI